MLERKMNGMNKDYDFCFIGTFRIDPETRRNRQWIIPFIDQYFTNRSFLQFTDDKTRSIDPITGASNYRPRGLYDHTLKRQGFVPKYVKEKIKSRNRFDSNYFGVMSRCKFCLAPAGDSFYSMRFLEALMTKCIPIVKTKHETFRSRRESKINYHYYLSKEFRRNRGKIKYRTMWTDINFETFLRHHTLEYFPQIHDDVYNVNNEEIDIHKGDNHLQRHQRSTVKIWDD